MCELCSVNVIGINCRRLTSSNFVSLPEIFGDNFNAEYQRTHSLQRMIINLIRSHIELGWDILAFKITTYVI